MDDETILLDEPLPVEPFKAQPKAAKPVTGIRKLMTPEGYANYVLPILGIAETIATKGERPGTTALQQQKIITDSIENQRQRKLSEEESRYKALVRKREEKTWAEEDQESENEKLFSASLAAIPEDMPEEDQKARIERAARKYLKPEKYIDFQYKTKPRSSSVYEQILAQDSPEKRTATLQIIDDLEKQKRLDHTTAELARQEIKNGRVANANDLLFKANISIDRELARLLESGPIKTQQAVNEAYSLIPPKVATVKATETAKTEADLEAEKIRRNFVQETGSDVNPADGKPFSHQQFVSAMYARVVKNALDQINRIEAKPGFDPTAVDNAVLTAIKENPGLTFNTFFARASDIMTPDMVQYASAKLSFLIPNLRYESGAVINAGEYIGGNAQYFPSYKEPPESVAFKKQQRQERLSGLRSEAGGAYDVLLRQTRRAQGIEALNKRVDLSPTDKKILGIIEENPSDPQAIKMLNKLLNAYQ